MGLLIEEINRYQPMGNRIEALKALTKLILHEVESLEEISPSKMVESEEIEINLPDKVQRYEANLIRHALLSANGNQSEAARKLGMKVPTLHAKIKRYEISSIGFLR